MKTASAYIDGARVSLKHSVIICKNLKNKKLDKAKKFLESLINKKISLDGKYYLNATRKILEVLKNAESNAKQKNLNTEKLFIKTAKADKGEKFLRPKSRWRFRGREAKSSSITIIVEER